MKNNTTDPMQWLHDQTSPWAFDVKPRIADDMLFDIWVIRPTGYMQRVLAAIPQNLLKSLLSDLNEDKFCFATPYVSEEQAANLMAECLAAFVKEGRTSGLLELETQANELPPQFLKLKTEDI